MEFLHYCLSLPGLTPSHFFAPVPSQNLDFRVICRRLFVFNDLRCNVFVNFVDIGGIVDQHSRNYRSSGEPKCYIMYYNNFGLAYGA